MIIVQLIGGLGNQMFQYAFGLSLSVRLEMPVKFDAQSLLDRTPRSNFTFRDFELDLFQGAVPMVTAGDTLLYGAPPTDLVAQFKHRLLCKVTGARRFVEKAYFVYDPAVLLVGRNTYFEGYWQNEKYFKSNQVLIREAFEFKTTPTGLNRWLADEIAVRPSVGMHVRRGDYIAIAQSNKVHGTCTPAYYRNAVQLIQERVGKFSLFVFSDEPHWARENLRFDLPTTYISHNHEKDSFEDMRLMSLCTHNIIANSSFSWWGAWLNINPTKIVVAPRQWMQSDIIDTSDLIPSEWIQI